MRPTLKRLSALAAGPPIAKSAIAAAVGDRDLAERIAVRVSPRARYMSLRVDPTNGQVVLIRPARASVRALLAFTASRRDWIVTHLAALPARVAFTDGIEIPLHGVSHAVCFLPQQRGGVWREDGKIFVTGRAEHGARRLKDWLKRHARDVIGPAARAMAERLNRDVAQVVVRDTTSRWGSCTHGGRLSFSWRLILAPEHILTYVIAHEVAHLKHMDHSAAFWRTVESLLDGKADVASARQWLRRHGTVLHRYG